MAFSASQLFALEDGLLVFLALAKNSECGMRFWNLYDWKCAMPRSIVRIPQRSAWFRKMSRTPKNGPASRVPRGYYGAKKICGRNGMILRDAGGNWFESVVLLAHNRL